VTTGPLAGLRVVELAGLGPAPFAAMLLADLGADVVRIDRPGARPFAGGPEHDLLGRGRRSVAVDLKSGDGPDVVLRLVERADVLLEGFRPGVTERLGIGPAECLARNPRLVYGRMTGWGQEGPLAATAGHDVGYIAVTGALHAIGRQGGPPQIPLNLVGDFGGGAMYLVVGVLAALLEARLSGSGQVVDAAIVDGTAHLATMVLGMLAGGSWRDARGENLLDSGAPWYDVYETADGRHLAVGALEPQFYAELVDRLGLADVAPDRAGADPALLRGLLADTIAGRTRDEWVEVFEGSDACVAPVLSFTEAREHPHLAARQTYVEHHGVVQPAPAPRFSRTRPTLGLPPARAGEHSRAALADWGIADVDALLAAGTVVQAEEQRSEGPPASP
jgi:alpha-methylacyl-CoA racemase